MVINGVLLGSVMDSTFHNINYLAEGTKYNNTKLVPKIKQGTVVMKIKETS